MLRLDPSPSRATLSIALAFCFAFPGAPVWAWETLRIDQAIPSQSVSLQLAQRTRYESLGEQFRVNQSGSADALVLRTLVHARAMPTAWLTVGAELQDSRAPVSSNTVLNTGVVNPVELLRAYLELRHSDVFGGQVATRMGRLTMDVGSRRFIARNRYRNTINAFTGIDFEWRGEQGRSVRAFWVLPVVREPVRPSDLEDGDVEFDSESLDYQLWGLHMTSQLPWLGLGELFVFGLHESDTEERPSRKRRLITPGFRIWRSPERGRFDYQLETAFQAGESRASAASTTDLDHFAHFHHATVGYTFDAFGTPRLALQYDYASGDDNPDDGDNNRFDTLFGARRFEFGPTGIYGPFARSNLNTPGVRAQWQPLESVSGFLAYRGYWLASDRDVWATTGVRDTTGSSGSFIGSQLEFRIRWRLLPGNLMLEGGYAHIFSGRFMDEADNSPQNGDVDYGYIALSLAI